MALLFTILRNFKRQTGNLLLICRCFLRLDFRVFIILVL